MQLILGVSGLWNTALWHPPQLPVYPTQDQSRAEAPLLSHTRAPAVKRQGRKTPWTFADTRDSILQRKG